MDHEWLHDIVQGWYMYDNVNQGIDDIFPFQRFFIIFQEVSS
jgi:hypothetical protein